MKLPQYITKEEVSRVCDELKIRDWANIKGIEVSFEEAEAILHEVNSQNMPIDINEFRDGLNVELEHGIRFPDANVTNNHPIVTGMIVLAHMKESLEYYKLLTVAEAEGDLTKAIIKGDIKKSRKYFRKLAEAKQALSKAQIESVNTDD
jgi:hypothetical protein